MTESNNYKVKFITDQHLLNQTLIEWKSFEETIADLDFYNSIDFLKIICESLNQSEKIKLRIIFLYKNSELKAIFPFILKVKKRYFISNKKLQFINQDFFSDSSDVIANDLTLHEFNYAINALKKKESFDLIHLQQVSPHSKVYAIFKNSAYCYSQSFLFNIKDYSNYEAYEKLYSLSHKQNLRSSKNKINKSNLTLLCFDETFKESELDTIEKISTSKLTENKSNIYSDKIKRSVIVNALNKFSGQIIYVCLNNKKVAYRVNVFFKNKKYCLDASYDREYRAYSVGILSVEFSLKNSFTLNLNSHTEGWGNDFYKKQFSTGYYYLYQIVIQGNSLLSSYFYNKTNRSMEAIQNNFLKNKHAEE